MALRNILQCAPGKDVHVLYIGDYDPAGVLIDRSIEVELANHGVPVTMQRIAINEEQIAQYDLPTKPRKSTDRRRLDIEHTVEAEAMPAGLLRRLLRDKIEPFLPAGALAAAKVAEKSERAWLLEYSEWRHFD